MSADHAREAAFIPTQLRAAARSLDDTAVHLWWLPHRRAQGRGPLKAVLAAYLDTDPEALALADDAHGRPHLAATRALDFNWSHSGDHALVAVARALPMLGVDIERYRPRPRALALAERFFSPAEHAALASLTESEREAAFARLWTAKEAVLKAHGRGIAYGLERVAFMLRDDDVTAQRFEGDIGPVGAWQFRALAPAVGFVGMAAWRGDARELRCYALADVDDGTV